MGNSETFLENWLKEQIGPKSLINRIKKEFPNWLEIAPQFPTLLHAYLNNHNKNSYTIIEKDIRKSIEGIKLRQDRIIIVMILLFVVITLQSSHLYKIISNFKLDTFYNKNLTSAQFLIDISFPRTYCNFHFLFHRHCAHFENTRFVH